MWKIKSGTMFDYYECQAVTVVHVVSVQSKSFEAEVGTSNQRLVPSEDIGCDAYIWYQSLPGFIRTHMDSFGNVWMASLRAVIAVRLKLSWCWHE